jgi:hypothetical protein
MLFDSMYNKLNGKEFKDLRKINITIPDSLQRELRLQSKIYISQYV